MSTKKTLVKARKGIRVPREGMPRRHILDTEPVQVTLTPYYRRAIRDGDLLVVEPSRISARATTTES